MPATPASFRLDPSSFIIEECRHDFFHRKRIRCRASRASDRSASATDIDYGRFLDCVHCGLCTSACPTYLETGNENDSPRGRIYLMRAVTDGRLDLGPTVKRHLDLCLDCRSCETACPSGVQYGRLIEPFRVGMRRAEAQAKERLRRRRPAGSSVSSCTASSRTPPA